MVCISCLEITTQRSLHTASQMDLAGSMQITEIFKGICLICTYICIQYLLVFKKTQMTGVVKIDTFVSLWLSDTMNDVLHNR